MNKVILIGNLGKDPEIKDVANNIKVASFSIATTEHWTDRNTNEKKSATEWHTIIAWRWLAQLAENYLRKGSQICVEGKLRTRSWEDTEGNKRYVTEVVADNISLLGRKSENSQSYAPTPKLEDHNISSASKTSSPSQPTISGTPKTEGNSAMPKYDNAPQSTTNPTTTEEGSLESTTENEDDLPF